MLFRSLRYPDMPDWHTDIDFSPTVSKALVEAYASLKRGPKRIKSYLQAHTFVEPLLNAPMSLRQRERMFFVMGQSYAASSAFPLALLAFDEAVQSAHHLNADGDLLDLLYARGAVNRALLFFGDAASDYHGCLSILHSQIDMLDVEDTTRHLEILSQVAGCEFFLAHYDEAERLLAEAHDRLATLQIAEQFGASSSHAQNDLRLIAATLKWLEAYLYRWRGQPELGLRPAAAAADIYAELESPISAARSQLFVADTALELAETFPDGSDRLAMAQYAVPHIELAMNMAHEAHDAIGEQLSLLSHTRFSRLAGCTENRAFTVKQVVCTAEKLEDEALLAQALTVLGDELHVEGHTEAALGCYRQVLAVLSGSEVPALGIKAQRILYRSNRSRTI